VPKVAKRCPTCGKEITGNVDESPFCSNPIHVLNDPKYDVKVDVDKKTGIGTYKVKKK